MEGGVESRLRRKQTEGLLYITAAPGAGRAEAARVGP